jgi:hypothetical protein
MPVKDLIWDLLNNGLDLTYFDAKAGHHHSMNLARFSHSNTLYTKRPSQKDKQEKQDELESIKEEIKTPGSNSNGSLALTRNLSRKTDSEEK